MRYGRSPLRNLKAEINVVPFLDVLLVLLLVFMITTPIISQSVEVDLPQDKHSTTATNDANLPVILQVQEGRRYKIKFDGSFVRVGNSEYLTADQVVVYAQKIMADNHNALFLVAGDRTVAYDEVIRALGLLKDAGINSVGLMTTLP